MSMARYIAFRLLVVVPVMVGIMVVTFFVTHVLPADPAVEAAGAYPTPALVRAARIRLGLNHSIFVQLWTYAKQVVQGNLGSSAVTGRSVATEIVDRLPSTLELITLSMVVACTLGVGVAIIASRRGRGIRDGVGKVYGAFGASVPDYFLALLLILLFYTALHVFPAPLGQAGPTAPTITDRSGAYFLDAILAGNGSAVWVGFQHLVLPVAALGIVFGSPIYRVARASIESIERSPYIDYVTMMGGGRRFVLGYVMQNALPPIVTLTGIIYGLLLGGAVLVETVFGWGGVGQYAVQAVDNADYYAIQGFVLMAALFSVLVYFAVDLLHAALDPRVRRAM